MSNVPEIYYQQLGPEHKDDLMSLTNECFPTSNYPDDFYENLLGKGSYSHGAFDKATDRLVGMVTGETQNILNAEDEVGTLLESVVSLEDTVVYIPIFGISKLYRRLGIGTSLIQRLLFHIQTCKDMRVVYLHVESSNRSAISFYDRMGFLYFTTIYGYYHSEGIDDHGIVYVMYINGGKPYMGGPRHWHKRFLRQCSIIGTPPQNHTSLVHFKRQNSV